MTSLTSRSLLALVLLGGGLALQSALYWHLTKVGPLPEVAPKRSFEEIMPVELGEWRGQDLKIEGISLYGDDHLKRVYIHQQTGQQVQLWIAYSKEGKDRGHHPEICLQASDWEEDVRGQDSIEHRPEKHKAKIHQFMYQRPQQAMWLYYWHYTLKPPPDPNIDQFQRTYQRTRKRYSSITIQTSTTFGNEDARAAVIDFVKLVDDQLQADLPENAVRGSDRTPVKRVEAH